MCHHCGPVLDEVRQVLLNAAHCQQDKNFGKCFLTVYQILARLPQQLQNALIQRHGFPGPGTGHGFTAAHEVMDVAETVPGVQLSWLDARRIQFDVAGQRVEPGAPRMQLYRIGDGGDAASRIVPNPSRVPPANIQTAVHQVLDRARRGVTQRQHGAGYGRCFLTDYQILALLRPTSMRAQLIQHHGFPTGTAAAVVRQAAESVPGVERIWLDAPSTQFSVGGQLFPPPGTTMPMYRIPGGVTADS